MKQLLFLATAVLLLNGCALSIVDDDKEGSEYETLDTLRGTRWIATAYNDGEMETDILTFTSDTRATLTIEFDGENYGQVNCTYIYSKPDITISSNAELAELTGTVNGNRMTLKSSKTGDRMTFRLD